MERAFKGVWIPKEIWESKELNLQEKILLTEIDSLDNDAGCFASNRYFADFMMLSERQIKRIISSVVDKKWVKSEITYKENSKEIEQRILKICRPPYPKKEKTIIKTPSDKNDTTPQDISDTNPSDKNVPDNNTYNNNIYSPSKDERESFLSENFEKIWQIYPRKEGKAKAFKSYTTWLKGKKVCGKNRKLTNKQMWYAVKKYAEESKEKEKTFIKMGSTFFTDAILDYVEEENEQISGG